jgi:hypothetical protein
MAVALKATAPLTQPLSKVAVCTTATLPTAANYAGHIILVTDGNAGLGCLAICDGVDWWPITIGTTHVASS